MDYGKKVRQFREKKGISQEYMATQLDMSQNAYSKLELGDTRLRVDTLKQISDILEVNPADFMLEESEQYKFNQSNTTVTTANSLAIYQQSFDEERKVWQELDKSRLTTIESLQLLIESQKLQIENLTNRRAKENQKE
jgi:transcriptional regulator with XRE-family HTH domain